VSLLFTLYLHTDKVSMREHGKMVILKHRVISENKQD
jgi:hypothetical protein